MFRFRNVCILVSPNEKEGRGRETGSARNTLGGAAAAEDDDDDDDDDGDDETRIIIRLAKVYEKIE